MSHYIEVTDVRTYLEHEDDSLDIVFGSLITRTCSIIDRQTTVTFGGPVQARKLDSGGRQKLYLPKPGAATVSTVVENGVTLSPTLYERDPIHGLFLLRLDSDGNAKTWVSGQRIVTVTYTPTPPPPDIQEICLQTVVRLWQGKEGGFTDTVGVAGINESTITRAFPAMARETFRRVRATYGQGQ